MAARRRCSATVFDRLIILEAGSNEPASFLSVNASGARASMHFNLCFMRSYLLLALLVLLNFVGWAEPLYPLLSKPQVDNLKRKLWQTSPSPARVNLLVRLSNDLVVKNQERNEPLDSAAAYINQAELLSKALRFTDGQIDSDYALGYLVLLDKSEQARKIILSALARSQQCHDWAREALGWCLLGYTYTDLPTQQPQRTRYFKQAAQLFHTNHDLRGEARSLKEVADTHLMVGKPALAREELLHVIALYRAYGYRELHYTFDLLAATNAALGNYKEALQYSLAAVQSAKICRDTTLLRAFYGRVASVYQRLDQHEKAIQYYQLAVRNAEQYQDVPAILDMTFATAESLIILHRPQQALALIQQKSQAFPPYNDLSRVSVAEALVVCYMVTKRYKLANAWRRRLETLSASPTIRGNRGVLEGVYYAIGAVYLYSKQYLKAKKYLFKAQALGQVSVSRGTVARTYLLLFKADSAQGNLLAAIAYYQRYKSLSDSVSKERNSKQAASLLIQYDTKEKEQSIALLTKQSLLQQMTIRQRGFQRNAFFVGAVLLVLVLGLGFNRYRLGQRSNRLLEEKQQLLQVQQAEISQKNQSLEQVVSEKETLLTEKEWMLKEIHHRVKNNLQVISSLLTNQSNYLRDPLASAAIRESRNRVQAMALIHQRLYQTDTLARVNMAEYVREIVNSLLESFDRFDTVTTQLNVAAVELAIALATPLGLIVNEAVTNVLKYAFPPAGRGTLTIALTEGPAHHFHLTIADDGVGLPPDFDLDQSHSLGLTIIKGLSTQIGGDLRIESANGVRVSLQFEAAKSVVQVG
jgi:two-component sensor histidine kinase